MSEAMLTMDMREVNERIQAVIAKAIPEAAADGLYEVGKQLLKDSISVEPKVPVGHYRAKAGKRTGVGGALKRSGKIERQSDGSTIVGFDMPYAGYQHEGRRSDGSSVVQNYTEPGAGKEFIKKKIEMYLPVYMKFLAEFIERKGSQ
jgi:hypothetical protein